MYLHDMRERERERFTVRWAISKAASISAGSYGWMAPVRGSPPSFQGDRWTAGGGGGGAMNGAPGGNIELGLTRVSFAPRTTKNKDTDKPVPSSIQFRLISQITNSPLRALQSVHIPGPGPQIGSGKTPKK